MRRQASSVPALFKGGKEPGTPRKCLVCGKAMKHRFATAEKPFPFTESGLDYVYLAGVDWFQCGNGHRVGDIPRMGQLMETIACEVVDKPGALTGAEVRLLRKRLGKKAVDFAEEIGIEPETLSRVENGRQTLSLSAGKLIRLYYALASDDPVLMRKLKRDSPRMLMRWADMPSKKKLVLQVVRGEWEAG